jgi:hypothetical protein
VPVSGSEQQRSTASVACRHPLPVALTAAFAIALLAPLEQVRANPLALVLGGHDGLGPRCSDGGVADDHTAPAFCHEPVAREIEARLLPLIAELVEGVVSYAQVGDVARDEHVHHGHGIVRHGRAISHQLPATAAGKTLVDGS